jgi:hypothetical protein
MYISEKYAAQQHFAIRLGDRVFDASTGPGGMLYAQYVATLNRLNGGSGAYVIQVIDDIENF